MHWKFESPFRVVAEAAGRRFVAVRAPADDDRWSLRIDGRCTGFAGTLCDCMETAVDGFAADAGGRAAAHPA